VVVAQGTLTQYEKETMKKG